MKRINNLLATADLWWGRAPLWRWVEVLVVAATTTILLALFLPRAAWPADADQQTLREAATASALEKTAEAQIATARVLQTLAERMALGGAQAAPQAPVVNAAAKTCDGFGSCLLGMVKASTEAVGDVVRAVSPLAVPYYGYKGAVVAAEANKVANQEATKQVGLRETTNQVGYQTTAQISNGATAALASVAAIPPLPTTAVTVNGNGPVNTGPGTITNASNNPITTSPTPVVVVGTTGTTVSRGP